MVGMVCSCDCYIIWTKALLYLHITPTEAAMKLPVFVSTVFVMMLMREEVWSSAVMKSA